MGLKCLVRDVSYSSLQKLLELCIGKVSLVQGFAYVDMVNALQQNKIAEARVC